MNILNSDIGFVIFVGFLLGVGYCIAKVLCKILFEMIFNMFK